MTLLESIFSGIVQGVTEFLPVSSSGHLVLLHTYFGINEANIVFDVFLHLATLIAVVIYFSKDLLDIIIEKNFKLILYIIVATIPAVAAGVFFESFITSFFYDIHRVGIMFFFTALLLLSAEISLRIRREPYRQMSLGRSIIIGIFQALALAPGISRSGSTISSALFCGISREKAFKFSFVLSIPVILGAVLYKFMTVDVNTVIAGNFKIYAFGMLAALISGMLCLRVLWWFVKTSRLYIFAIYCFILGTITLIF